MGFNGTNGVNGTQGPPGPNQIPPTKHYRASAEGLQTIPVNGSSGFASATVTCNPGDTLMSPQPLIRPQVRDSFPGSGSPPESLSG
jgi:hypothetical protein